MEDANKVLELRGVSKAFPGVLALDEVSMEVRAGEVHALCGENGAGKSTLMHILAGNHQPDRGEIWLRGARVAISDQRVAQRLGIGIVYQERSLIGQLSVAENIFAGRTPANRLGLIRRRVLSQGAQALLYRLGINYIHPGARVDTLSPALRQMVEIAKALALAPDILILDEPTAAITDRETRTLFGIVDELRRQGRSVIYISHRLAEIFAIADRVSILKDGRYQGVFPVKDISADDLVRRMVGRDLAPRKHESSVVETPLLEARALKGERFQELSFTLRQGEILALAGLVGAGRSEVARAIFGADPLLGGEIRLKGKALRIEHPARAIRAGIVYLAENRKEQSLFLARSVADNIAAAHLKATARGPFISRKKFDGLALRFVKQLGIRTPSIRQPVALLSGGNQQKVALAKWLARPPLLLIADEPTQGVDVGAKAEIYNLLRQLAARGTGILLISSELPEVLSLSDRILVLREGRLAGELSREAASEEAIMHYASGTK
jgi:ABC-type sugar transport system ATPase subunit